MPYSLTYEDIIRADKTWAAMYSTRQGGPQQVGNRAGSSGGLTEQAMEVVLARLRDRVSIRVDNHKVARWALWALYGVEDESRVANFARRLTRRGLVWDLVRPRQLIYRDIRTGEEGVLLRRFGISSREQPDPHLEFPLLVECPFDLPSASRAGEARVSPKMVPFSSLRLAVHYDPWEIGALVDNIPTLGVGTSFLPLPGPCATEFFSGHSSLFVAMKRAGIFLEVFRVECDSRVWSALRGNVEKRFRNKIVDFDVLYQDLSSAQLRFLYSGWYAHLSPECGTVSLQAQATHRRGVQNAFCGATPLAWHQNGVYRSICKAIEHRLQEASAGRATPFFFTLESPASGCLLDLPIIDEFRRNTGAQVIRVQYCRWRGPRSGYRYRKETVFISNIPGLKEHIENLNDSTTCTQCDNKNHDARAERENSPHAARIPDKLAQHIVSYLAKYLRTNYPTFFNPIL